MANIEIERKYIIKRVSHNVMRNMDSYSSSAITQTYLNSELGVTHRVRRRCYSADRVEYTETKKIRIDRSSAIEDEREIDETAYRTLLLNIRNGSHPIEKVRHTFVYHGKLIEIDEYAAWENTCIMETELSSSDERVELPPFVEIVKEVTGEREYSNSSMSSHFPEETV